jgi:hypothetical protein
MNVLIGSAAGVCGTVFSDQVLLYHLPPCGGIIRLMAAPAHAYIGCLYAVAATGSAPVTATAALTAGVLFAWHPNGLLQVDRFVSEFLNDSERHLKNGTRRMVAYARSFGSKTETAGPSASDKPNDAKPTDADADYVFVD